MFLLAAMGGCGNVERDEDESDVSETCDPICAHVAECAWPTGAAGCEAECGCFAGLLLEADASESYYACVADRGCDEGPPEVDCGDAAAAVVGTADEAYYEACAAASCEDLPCGLYALLDAESLEPLFECLDEADCGHVLGCSHDVLSALCGGY